MDTNVRGYISPDKISNVNFFHWSKGWADSLELPLKKLEFPKFSVIHLYQKPTVYTAFT